MDSSSVSFLLGQLAYQAPLLLACIVGLVLSLVFWKRYPSPALLVLLGSGLQFTAALGVSFAQWYFFVARMDRGWEMERYAWFMSGVSLAGAVARALAFGLVLTAVFVGRKQVWKDRYEAA